MAPRECTGTPSSSIVIGSRKGDRWPEQRFGLIQGLNTSFLFSSIRRHTILVSDWSSDVCSSDLGPRHDELLPDDPDLRLFRARDRRPATEIGRASCRERGWISVGAVSLKKK